MRNLIQRIQNKHNLSQTEIESIMHEIMSGKAAEADIRDYLLALNDKGPTVEEITGAATIMREFVVRIPTKHTVVLDTCGTGGDHRNTFNISTISALVVAGAGVIVAKHGNRSVSSNCGSADILEALGVNIKADGIRLSACLDQVGIAFLFAQGLHPAMKNVAPVRKALGVKTIFNILGPLTNPANATHQMMGVYSRDLVEPMANVLKNLGSRRAVVVHGHDGLDELTTTGKSFVCEYTGSDVVSYDVDPEEFGIAPAALRDLEGGGLEDNVRITQEILNGKKGPKQDIVILNAGFALYISEVAHNVAEGINLARLSLESGKALEKLNQLKEFTNRG